MNFGEHTGYGTVEVVVTCSLFSHRVESTSMSIGGSARVAIRGMYTDE